MRLESAAHFCEQILSGKLYSNQLIIKDGKLIQKADAEVSTINDTLTKDSNPVTLMSEKPKVVLSASPMPQTKQVRPPSLVSVGTQVYASLLDSAATGIRKDSQQNTDIVGLGLQNPQNFRCYRSKLHQTVSGNRTHSDINKTSLLSDVSSPHQQSLRVRRKPCKLIGTAESYSKSMKCLPSKVIRQTATCSDVTFAAADEEAMKDRNITLTGTVTVDSDSLKLLNEKSVDRRLSADDLDSGGKFQCSLCGFSTNNVRKISEHNREHQRANNICYYCEQRFGSSAELSVHVEVDHFNVKTSRTPFVCSSCPAQFRTRAQLMAHLPKHSSTRPFICAKCGASFKWRTALHDHAATHTSRKEHLCDICGYATAHRSQLRSHRLVHTGGTMCCSWQGCDFRATRMQNLKYHLLTHTQEKPYQCEICGQSFSLAKNLKRHMLSHIKTAAKHSCSRCGFSTLRYDKLKEHLHKQHKVGSAPERRVRITDLVNLEDMAKCLEGSVCQPVLPESTEQQSLDASNTAVVGQTVSCVVDLNASGAGTCSETQQAVIDGSVVLVEPADFLLGSIHLQTLKFHIPPASGDTNEASADDNVSSMLLDADSVKE